MKKTFGIAVKGVLIHNGKMLTIKRSNYDGHGTGWECPGGGIRFGEMLEEALVREFMEEVGIKVTVGRLLYVDAFLWSDIRQVAVMTYLCEADSLEVTLSHEHTEYRWASAEELRGLLMPAIVTAFEKNGVFQLPEFSDKQ